MKSIINKFYVFAISAALLTSSSAMAQEDGLASLKGAIAKYKQAAQLHDKGAKLFHLSGLISIDGANSGISFVNADFSIPGNNVKYLSATWGNNFSVEVKSAAFVVVQCGGAYRPDCGKETGQAEPSSMHPAIRGVKIDVPEMVAALEAAGMAGDPQLSFTLTTPGRSQGKATRLFGRWTAELSGNSAAALKALPSNRGVIVFTKGAFQSKFDYIILDSQTGTVVARGTGKNLPPPPGAVSSGN